LGSIADYHRVLMAGQFVAADEAARPATGGDR
jgi:hypothetical protein